MFGVIGERRTRPEDRSREHHLQAAASLGDADSHGNLHTIATSCTRIGARFLLLMSFDDLTKQ